MKNIDLLGWLKNWFYTKEENYNKTTVDGLLTDKLNTNLGVANRNVVTDENGNVSLEEKSGNNGFGSFYVNDEGHLIAVIPSNVNPYKIIDGHLIYDTEAT